MSITRSIDCIGMVAIFDGLTNGAGRREFDRIADLLNVPAPKLARQLFSSTFNEEATIFDSAISLFEQVVSQINESLLENMRTEDALQYLASQVREVILKYTRLPVDIELAMIVLDTIQRELGVRVEAHRRELKETINDIEDLDPRFGNGY